MPLRRQASTDDAKQSNGGVGIKRGDLIIEFDVSYPDGFTHMQREEIRRILSP
jgi:hypothetical protein